jgi:HEAT repeat protein
MLRRQLTEANDVIGRILAARELIKTGKRTNIEAVVAAYHNEPFWGVREEFVKALAKANSEVSLAGLVEIIQTEQDPLVLPAVFRAAGEYRDIRIRDAVGQRLEGELKPTARREAYAAMGAQRKNAQWQVLLAGSRQTGFNGLAQTGAFEGLAATRREEATEYLMGEIVYGKHSNRVRPAITTALAEIGQGLDKLKREQVVEILTDLLRDPWENVRWRAAAGLKNMPAPEAIPALEAYSSSLSKQMQVYAEKMIDSLRGEDKRDGSAVKKQVEDLNEKVRKLEDQLQRLEAQVNHHQSPE